MIKNLSEAIDALDDFLDDLDEECGLAALRYGDEAYEALEFLHEYILCNNTVCISKEEYKELLEYKAMYEDLCR